MVYGIKGFKKQVQTGLEWLNKAAAQNLPNALYELSKIYRGGIAPELEKSQEKANELLLKASNLGFARANSDLATYCLCGTDGFETDQDEAYFRASVAFALDSTTAQAAEVLGALHSDKAVPESSLYLECYYTNLAANQNGEGLFHGLACRLYSQALNNLSIHLHGDQWQIQGSNEQSAAFFWLRKSRDLGNEEGSRQLKKWELRRAKYLVGGLLKEGARKLSKFVTWAKNLLIQHVIDNNYSAAEEEGKLRAMFIQLLEGGGGWREIESPGIAVRGQGIRHVRRNFPTARAKPFFRGVQSAGEGLGGGQPGSLWGRCERGPHRQRGLGRPRLTVSAEEARRLAANHLILSGRRCCAGPVPSPDWRHHPLAQITAAVRSSKRLLDEASPLSEKRTLGAASVILSTSGGFTTVTTVASSIESDLSAGRWDPSAARRCRPSPSLHDARGAKCGTASRLEAVNDRATAGAQGVSEWHLHGAPRRIRGPFPTVVRHDSTIVLLRHPPLSRHPCARPPSSLRLRLRQISGVAGYMSTVSLLALRSRPLSQGGR
ncbi:hypothetical protein THAOC_25198, partial [Thalassiosira oceanica]